MESKPVILFDGVCNLCNFWVDFVIKNDTREYFLFASLQSEFARKNLAERQLDTNDLDTVYLLLEDNLYNRSEAILRMCAHFNGGWKFLSIFRFIPRILRDFIYKLIAKNRYLLFGKKDSCRLPTPEERARFLE